MTAQTLQRPDSAALSTTGVRHRFGVMEVLRGVDLRVTAGEVVGVVGPNGAGKTTLVDVLTGALGRQTGSVALAGKDVSRSGAAVRTKQGLARTHQVPRSFGGLTVFENVLVGASAVTSDRAAAHRTALAAVDATGTGHLANRPAAELGLLDRERLELAGALATGPSVLRQGTRAADGLGGVVPGVRRPRCSAVTSSSSYPVATGGSARPWRPPSTAWSWTWPSRHRRR